MANWQVISLDTTTPQLRAPGTGDGYSFNSGSTQLGVWTTTGLGIGTASPTYQLDLQGGTTNNTRVRLLRGTDDVNQFMTLGWDRIQVHRANVSLSSPQTALSFNQVGSDGTRTAMIIDSSGNVGIGTTSPQYRFHVVGATTSVSAFRRTTADDTQILVGNTAGDLQIRALANGNGLIYSDTGKTLGFGSNGSGTAQLTLDTSGNLGIGTTSPGAKLNVDAGSAGLMSVFDSTNANGGYLLGRSSGTAVWDLGTAKQALDVGGATDFGVNVRSGFMAFGTNNIERARITSGGAFCVGSTDYATAIVLAKSTTASTSVYNSWNSATSGTRFHFEFRDGTGATSRGSITTDGANTAFNTSSDRRLKQNIVPCADAGVVIDAIEVVEFDWKSGSHTRFGMIAQNLHLVAPEAVKTGDDGEEVSDAWGVDYSKLVPMLVKEIQSLRARVAQLEAK